MDTVADLHVADIDKHLVRHSCGEAVEGYLTEREFKHAALLHAGRGACQNNRHG